MRVSKASKLMKNVAIMAGFNTI